ncbi:hypothetical protein H2O64_20285 [Kordia sp. YSTF-M3]|uniref:Lipoprotein n=1 Tax=Kordia aestuariivivens TaxID=2759037 RepID=A0ABR7QEM5_9FLAO|nr:hypothetical protein [Kordia aestuariivivens]MBC8757022.1 hypothetical protein [Kordia aestuariivivens]
MKKVILSSIIALLLLSCSKKEQYYGTWTCEFSYGASPTFMKIDADSISLSESGNYWNTYPLSINNNCLTFLDNTFKTSISKDSMVFEGNVYKKDSFSSLLNIKLPELKTYHFQEANPDEKLIYIKYGKVPNSNEFKLQLNDKYANFAAILDYFSHEVGSCSKLSSPARVVLICDKDAKMEDLEYLFFELTKMNALVFYTVDHVKYKVIDQEIEQKIFSQENRITPIFNIKYNQKINDMDFEVIYTTMNDKPLEDFKFKNTQSLFLVNDRFHIGKKQYNLETFTKKVDSIVSNNTQLVSLFDLKSNYKHFTIFNAVINDAYLKHYDAIAKQKFNTTYEQLNSDGKAVIKALLQKENIQNISISHFLSFAENPKFPFKNIKEQLPEAYFKQLE